MIDWKQEAIEAALDAYYPNWRGRYQETNNLARQEMRATLDAAVKAQGLVNADLKSQLAATQARLSEYARTCDEQQKKLVELSNLIRNLWEARP